MSTSLSLSFLTAQLSVYHGRVSANSASVRQVRGVTVLNLAGSMINHFIDCYSATDSPSQLSWSREGGIQRFPTSQSTIVVGGEAINTFRMDLTPLESPVVGYDDEDIYTCTNERTGESMSINITGGE